MQAFICGCASTALTQDERDFLADADPWGLILFARNCEDAEQIRRLTDEFRTINGRDDAPVLIDQEGGRVQRLGPPNWRKYPPARRFAEVYRKDATEGARLARAGARLMADDLRKVGINVNCLPVADVPQPGAHEIIGDRAYGEDVDEIAVLARAAADGCLDGGVLPVIKHIPGHGRAGVDSHVGLPVVDAGREELADVDFAVFRQLRDFPLAMTAHVIYSAFDAERPATLSETVVRDVIRGEIGYAGLVMTDDLSMGALSGTLKERAEAAFAAGCDMALHCNGEFDEMLDVAEATPELDGEALVRAHGALARLSESEPWDSAKAVEQIEVLC